MTRALASKTLLSLLVCLALLGCTPARADVSSDTGIGLERVAGGFASPLLVTHAGDGSGRLFVVEQSGKIYILKDGRRLETPFLDVSNLISAGGEKGLLGLAFHPDYASNGMFFINYTNNQGGSTTVARYQVSADANVADASSAEILLTFEQPFGNHNGGNIAFSPQDGYLYIGTGDGGDGGDPRQYGQALNTYLGKLLRIDVNTESGYRIPDDNPWASSPDAVREIWAYGLRNPWRFSFDNAGNLYIGDVGQSLFEEISFQAADSAGGENYGWRTMEGFSCFNPKAARSPLESCDETGLTLPVLVYDHGEGNSVAGGYLYEGAAVPDLQGHYVYGDINGKIWTARPQGERWDSQLLLNAGFTLVTFGEDEAGELYTTNFASGDILKFVQK